MKGRVVGMALGAAVTIVACGAEDIELAHGDAATDAGRAGGGEAGDEASRFLGDASPPVCDASAPATACLALGDPCGSASDCCSTHCASKICAPPGACAGAGSSCSSRTDCCSGRCEPVNGSSARTCLLQCSPAGARCSRASDCCALGCNAGVCSGGECQTEGSDCANNAQCCSNLCDASRGNKCALDPVATCRPSGEDCSSGGNAPCCGACNDSAQRCDPGAGPCRVIGAICEADTDCCHGACDPPDGEGRRLCTSSALADGQLCQAGFECMSGSCVGNPPSCGPAAAPCTPSGAACSSSIRCCSGLCGAGGTCQTGCMPSSR